MQRSECDHREMEGYEHKMFAMGPKCRRVAKFQYEWGYDEINVCGVHAEELPADIELEELTGE